MYLQQDNAREISIFNSVPIEECKKKLERAFRYIRICQNFHFRDIRFCQKHVFFGTFEFAKTLYLGLCQNMHFRDDWVCQNVCFRDIRLCQTCIFGSFEFAKTFVFWPNRSFQKYSIFVVYWTDGLCAATMLLQLQHERIQARCDHTRERCTGLQEIVKIKLWKIIWKI